MFSMFWLKMPIFHATRGMKKNLILLLVNSEFLITFFVNSSSYLVRIVHFGSKIHISVIFE